MKPALRIPTIRKIATGAVIVIVLGFFGFISYLWVGFGAVLGDDVDVGSARKLLTNFDTSKFDRAVERLEKRRNLESPADNLHDPFGTVTR